MSGHQPSQQVNVGSLLLTQGENESLFSYLGRKCISLSSAVVEVLTADRNGSWNKTCSGVACLVKDNPQRSYFIRVFDIKDGKVLFEQEVHANFSINLLTSDVITFAGDTCQTSLKFSSEEESKRFHSAMTELLKRRWRKSAHFTSPSAFDKNPEVSCVPHLHNSSLGNTPVQSSPTRKTKKMKKKKKKKELTKADIGTPINFQHVSHVGWNPDTGFDLDNLDPELRNLFELAGITETELKDRETAKVIHDFIEERGGVEAVKKEVRTQVPSMSTASIDIKGREISGVHSSSQVNNIVQHSSSRNTKKKKKKKLTKADIGTPSNFQHTSHVGWNPNTSLDLNNLDPELKCLFEQAGVSETKLKDRKTAKVIHNFIEERGGVEAVKNEVRTQVPSVSTATVHTKKPQIGSHQLNKTVQSNPVRRSKKNKKKKKLTKTDIGTPNNFQHVSHVGWDPSTGFDLNNLDPELKNLFDMAGISEAELKDRETSKAIYDFIEKNGGVEAVKNEVRRQVPPSPQHQNSTPASGVVQGASQAPPHSRPSVSAKPPPSPSTQDTSTPPTPLSPPNELIPAAQPQLNPVSSCSRDSHLDQIGKEAQSGVDNPDSASQAPATSIIGLVT